MPRSDDLRRFLSDAGWGDAAARPLAGDASARRYQRLTHPALDTAVLMDAPPETGENIRPFCRIAEHLSALGLSAPRLLAADPDAGFLLLEDLGDALFARLIAEDPSREVALYEAAADTLLALHRAPPPAGLPPLGPPEMAAAVDLAVTWYAAGCGAPAPARATADLGVLVRAALDALPAGPSVLALRDFHTENLIWLPGRNGAARVGLLDFQDAFAGSPAYDLVSLVEDARRDVSGPARAAAIARFTGPGGHDPDTLSLALATLGAQRNLRILGVFARLCLRDGKAQYTALLPRVWGHLERDLAHPALADLAAFVRHTLPEPTPARLQRISERCGTCPTP